MSEQVKEPSPPVDWKFITSIAGPALALATGWISMQSDIRVQAKNVEVLQGQVTQLQSVITKQAVTDEKLTQIDKRLETLSTQLTQLVSHFTRPQAAPTNGRR